MALSRSVTNLQDPKCGVETQPIIPFKLGRMNTTTLSAHQPIRKRDYALLFKGEVYPTAQQDSSRLCFLNRKLYPEGGPAVSKWFFFSTVLLAICVPGYAAETNDLFTLYRSVMENRSLAQSEREMKVQRLLASLNRPDFLGFVRDAAKKEPRYTDERSEYSLTMHFFRKHLCKRTGEGRIAARDPRTTSRLDPAKHMEDRPA